MKRKIIPNLQGWLTLQWLKESMALGLTWMASIPHIFSTGIQLEWIYLKLFQLQTLTAAQLTLKIDFTCSGWGSRDLSINSKLNCLIISYCKLFNLVVFIVQLVELYMNRNLSDYLILSRLKCFLPFVWDLCLIHLESVPSQVTYNWIGEQGKHAEDQ